MPLVGSGGLPDPVIMTMTRGRSILRVVVGALVGLVAGAIASINVVIFAGIEDGYEASVGEVFEQNALVGVIAALVLVAGPIAGIIVALRVRPPQG
jgi:hypothetical protein